jgi:hypothetical protein
MLLRLGGNSSTATVIACERLAAAGAEGAAEATAVSVAKAVAPTTSAINERVVCLRVLADIGGSQLPPRPVEVDASKQPLEPSILHRSPSERRAPGGT